jgi:hypothetical protein
VSVESLRAALAVTPKNVVEMLVPRAALVSLLALVDSASEADRHLEDAKEIIQRTMRDAALRASTGASEVERARRERALVREGAQGEYDHPVYVTPEACDMARARVDLICPAPGPAAHPREASETKPDLAFATLDAIHDALNVLGLMGRVEGTPEGVVVHREVTRIRDLLRDGVEAATDYQALWHRDVAKGRARIAELEASLATALAAGRGDAVEAERVKLARIGEAFDSFANEPWAWEPAVFSECGSGDAGQRVLDRVVRGWEALCDAIRGSMPAPSPAVVDAGRKMEVLTPAEQANRDAMHAAIFGPAKEVDLDGYADALAAPAVVEASEGKCEVCGWPCAKDAASGCVPGNCSYRPPHGTGEYARIARRRKALAAAAEALTKLEARGESPEAFLARPASPPAAPPLAESVRDGDAAFWKWVHKALSDAWQLGYDAAMGDGVEPLGAGIECESDVAFLLHPDQLGPPPSPPAPEVMRVAEAVRDKALEASGAGRCSCSFARCGHDEAGGYIREMDLAALVARVAGEKS